VLALQGSSPMARNFTGLTGASVEDVVSRVPSSWTWAPQKGGNGLRFFDENLVERLRIHDINPNAPAGSNSAAGWIVRVQNTTAGGKVIYFDDLGNIGSKLDNATHIPLAGNPNAGR